MGRSVIREFGFPGLMWTLVVMFAAATVVLAIGVMTQGYDIADRAAEVDEELTGVNRDAEAIAYAGETARIARDIHAEVEPLPELLRREVAVVNSIQATAASIERTVASIHAGVVEVHSGARSIRGEVASIGQAAHEILADFRALLPVTESIDRRIAGINIRIARALVPIRAVRRHLDATLQQVGPGLGEPPGTSIHGHANNVNCSPVVPQDQQACHGPGEDPEGHGR